MNVIIDVPITDSMLSSTNVAETDETKWDGTGSLAAGTRRMVVDSTGSPSVITHKIYEVASGGDSSQDPTADDGTNWTEVSSTNAWKMFDDIVQDQTEKATQIDVDVAPGAIVNTIGLLDLEASDVTVIFDDPTDGEVYNQNHDLTDNSAIFDAYEYCFAPIKRKRNFVIEGLPPYSSATITVQVNSGGTAKVGKVTFGRVFNIGVMQRGSVVGIIDYSVKDLDENERATITPGDYANTGKFFTKFDQGNEEAIARAMTDARGQLYCWYGASDLGYSIIYGFPREWRIRERAGLSEIELDIEGMAG